MKTSTCLKISAICFTLLGIFVLVTIWFTPNVLPYFENPEAMTAARAWGDINGILFLSFGLLSYLTSTLNDITSKKLISFGNFIVTLALLCAATFHHLVLHSGPPPPVFILVSISGGFTFYAWRKSID
tara:strand:+ start:62 stop:445 length:384 start_codon:yes stop_codon:yes gene_type:complete